MSFLTRWDQEIFASFDHLKLATRESICTTPGFVVCAATLCCCYLLMLGEDGSKAESGSLAISVMLHLPREIHAMLLHLQFLMFLNLGCGIVEKC